MELGIKKAVKELRMGGVVVFPTDTVWGVGAAVSSKSGLVKLYRVKKRAPTKPTAILVSSMHMAQKYGELDGKAWDLAAKYWPGGVTLVVKARKASVPMMVRGGGDKVGLRIPKHDLAIELIEKLGEGVVAASANRAGEAAPKHRNEIDHFFLHEVDLVMGGKAGGQASSTVIDTCNPALVVLRAGEVKVIN